jgi:ADP-ribose pyrophosphatase YjhB (NUDIX family)
MPQKDKQLKQIISCGSVTHRKTLDQNDIEILLIQQFADCNIWGIPKGKIKQNESFEACAIRETLEETGIQIKLGTKLSEVDFVVKNKHKTVIAYLARQICNNEPRADDPDSEVAAAKWFKISELPTIIEYQQPIIFEALRLI